jgi:NAD(P)-dependent dehydrogenase (short-subunit alcohol dehydrogenase family)
VLLLGRKVPKLSKAYDAVKALGPMPALYPMDLAGADPADYEQMAARIVDDLGGLHGVLHCAAEFTGLRPLETTPPEDFVRNLHVNLSAPWLLTQACLPALRAQADSAVVFLLDDPERVSRAYWGPYAVAKAGLLGLAKVLDDETDNGPVRVSALQPRPMHSNIRSRAFVEESAVRVPSPLRTAHACVHLLSPAGAAWRGEVLRDEAPPAA